MIRTMYRLSLARREKAGCGTLVPLLAGTLLLFASVAVLGAGASAGDAPVNQSRGDGTRAKIEEVVVTAQRRAENIMDVPLSITALSADSITDRGLINSDDYLRSVPAVSYVDQGPGFNTVVIRGAHGNAFSTGPTVGRYLADIPLTGLALGASADIKLVDMDRVEILRGPQGTLYGSNSLSGTVRSIPVAPRLDELSARLSVGYSSTQKNGGNNIELQGIFNVPILGNRVAIRGVAYRFDNSGYIKNIGGEDPVLQASAAFFGASGQAINEDHVGGATTDGGRLSALWAATDNLNVNVTYLRQKDSADDRPFSLRSLGEYRRSEYAFGPAVGDGDALEIDVEIANLTVDYRTPWGTFLSSTSDVDQRFRRLWQTGPFWRRSGFTPPMPQDSISGSRMLTEELRFSSSFEGPLQVVVGVFYEDSEQPTYQTQYYTGDPARSPFAGGNPVNFSGTPIPASAVFGGGLDREVEQLAEFGELSYTVTPRLKVTGGMRHFKYDSAFVTGLNGFSVNPQLVAASPGVVLNSEESGNTFKGGVDFKLTESTLLYATYSEGFRLGRPKPIPPSGTQTRCDQDGDGFIDGTQIGTRDPLIRSDSLNSYEIGVKAALLGGRATLAASAYSNDWTDIPVTFLFPQCVGSTTINGGEAQARGLEIEGSLRLIENLQFSFGVGYVDSELSSTTTAGNDGDRMNFTPEVNGNLSAEYGFTLAGRDAFLRSDYLYFGEYFTGIGETGIRFGGYGLLNFSAGITFDEIDARVFVDNVTDKYAITSVASFGFPPDQIHTTRPRTVGLRLGMKF